MTITIDFDGLNKILCKLGFHRWFVYEGTGCLPDSTYGLWRFCQDCNREEQLKRPT